MTATAAAMEASAAHTQTAPQPELDEAAADAPLSTAPTTSPGAVGSGRDAPPATASAPAPRSSPAPDPADPEPAAHLINAYDPPSAAQLALRSAQIAEEVEVATRAYHASVDPPPRRGPLAPRALVLGIVRTWPNCVVGSIAEGSHFKRCGGSRNCQEGDWRRHRPECKAATAARKVRERDSCMIVPYVAQPELSEDMVRRRGAGKRRRRPLPQQRLLRRRRYLQNLCREAGRY